MTLKKKRPPVKTTDGRPNHSDVLNQSIQTEAD